jgi:hypothetical protein
MRARQRKSGGAASMRTSKRRTSLARIANTASAPRFPRRSVLWRRARSEESRAAVRRRLGIRGGSSLWSSARALGSGRGQAGALRGQGPRVRLLGNRASLPAALNAAPERRCPEVPSSEAAHRGRAGPGDASRSGAAVLIIEAASRRLQPFWQANCAPLGCTPPGAQGSSIGCSPRPRERARRWCMRNRGV